MLAIQHVLEYATVTYSENVFPLVSGKCCFQGTHTAVSIFEGGLTADLRATGADKKDGSLKVASKILA